MGRIFRPDSIGGAHAGAGGISQIHGTPNQINVVESDNEVTLSTPQDIDPNAQPSFRRVTIGTYPGENGSDAATVDYVLNLITGAKPKGVVKAVMITAVPLSGEQVVDNILCIPGDRVLRNAADAPELNGIYDVQEGAWTRALNNDVWEEMPGAIVIAAEGEAFGGSHWVCDAVDGGTIDVTANTWVMLRDPASVPEAPTDSRRYVRSNGAWEVMARALSALWYAVPAPDTMPYYDVTSGGQVTPLTPFARQLLADINDFAMRRTIGAFASYSTPLDIDLNRLGFVEDAGVYRQPSNDGATSEHHYPVNRAGTLLVTPSAYGCQQEYTMYMDPRKFMRALTGPFDGTGPWSEWVEIQRSLPWPQNHKAYIVTGHDSSGKEVRRYYFSGEMMPGGTDLLVGVKLIVDNGLMVLRPGYPGQWHSMQNLPSSGEHLSALFINENTLGLYLPVAGSPWEGAPYKGYVTVVMA